MSTHSIIKGDVDSCKKELRKFENEGCEVYILNSHYDQDTKQLIIIIGLDIKMLNG